ncbi:MAG: hypothetical protein KKA84_09680 [Bacteroidetes bacterium]|nr:hypothetical protein [Bacteroidota bacterium]
MNEVIKNNKDIESVGNGFVEFITVSVKYRWFLFWFVFIITVTATAFALLSDKWYKSTASVLPAEKNDFLGALSGISSLAKGFSASKGLAALTGGGGESDKFVAILQSQTMIDDVIKKFELRKVYDLEDDFYEKVVKEYKSNVEIEIQDEGNLSIDVFDTDPQRATDIANYLIGKLNEINTELSVTNARANREFIEKRYFQNKDDIDSLEMAMQLFQQEYGVIAVPEQLEATVKAMSGIYATLAEKEVEYNVLIRQYGENHPLLTTTKLQMEELQKKISEMNFGKGSFSRDNVNMLIPFKKAPELGNAYIQIYRNLEVQYKILEFVTPLYEQAKVEEVRNTPSVLILDKPYPADRKSKPKGSLYAIVSFVVSMIIGFYIVFMLALRDKFRVNYPERYSSIVNLFRRDLARFGIKNRVKN